MRKPDPEDDMRRIQEDVEVLMRRTQRNRIGLNTELSADYISPQKLEKMVNNALSRLQRGWFWRYQVAKIIVALRRSTIAGREQLTARIENLGLDQHKAHVLWSLFDEPSRVHQGTG